MHLHFSVPNIFPSHAVFGGEPAIGTRCGRSFTRCVVRLFDRCPFAAVLVAKPYTRLGNAIVKIIPACQNPSKQQIEIQTPANLYTCVFFFLNAVPPELAGAKYRRCYRVLVFVVEPQHFGCRRSAADCNSVVYIIIISLLHLRRTRFYVPIGRRSRGWQLTRLITRVDGGDATATT